MGYACPVCEHPQADAGHLANHVAFTAMLGDDDHEAWLDEHAPGWGEMGEADLANVVVDHVEETAFPQVFEDTAGSMETSSPDPPGERSGMLFEEQRLDDGTKWPPRSSGRNDPASPVTRSETVRSETREILAEAREMTREMLRDEKRGDESAEESTANSRSDDQRDHRDDNRTTSCSDDQRDHRDDNRTDENA